MKLAAILAACSVATALAATTPSAALGQLAPPPLGELMLEAKLKDEEVRAIREQLEEAEVAAAFARARLARAEGKPELAASEWRKVLRHREANLERVNRAYARGLLCFVEPGREASGEVAIARVWLADLEGRRDELLLELPKAIEYFEWQERRTKTLQDRYAISPKEARQLLKQAGDELRWARERLATLRSGRDGLTQSTGP